MIAPIMRMVVFTKSQNAKYEVAIPECRAYHMASAHERGEQLAATLQQLMAINVSVQTEIDAILRLDMQLPAKLCIFQSAVCQ